MHRNKRFVIKEFKRKLPSRTTMVGYYMDPGKGVVMVPVISGKVLLERQYRAPLKKWIYELPAGRLEKGESSAIAAKRELLEETGYEATSAKYLFSSYSSPGITIEQLPVFLMTGLKKRKSYLDRDEVIKTKLYSVKELLKMVKNNKINDGKTIEGILFYTQFVKRSGVR